VLLRLKRFGLSWTKIGANCARRGRVGLLQIGLSWGFGAEKGSRSHFGGPGWILGKNTSHLQLRAIVILLQFLVFYYQKEHEVEFSSDLWWETLEDGQEYLSANIFRTLVEAVGMFARAEASQGGAAATVKIKVETSFNGEYEKCHWTLQVSEENLQAIYNIFSKRFFNTQLNG